MSEQPVTRDALLDELHKATVECMTFMHPHELGHPTTPISDSDKASLFGLLDMQFKAWAGMTIEDYIEGKGGNDET